MGENAAENVKIVDRTSKMTNRIIRPSIAKKDVITTRENELIFDSEVTIGRAVNSTVMRKEKWLFVKGCERKRQTTTQRTSALFSVLNE